jgi:dienelactone hydrolase
MWFLGMVFPGFGVLSSKGGLAASERDRPSIGNASMIPRWALALTAVLALCLPGPAGAADGQIVEVPSRDGTRLSARLFRPTGQGPFAAVVMLHGCGGLVSSKGELSPRKKAWAEIFVGMGYIALLPDSFRSRGHGSLCKVKDRPVLPQRERPYDAYGALAWLQAQPFVKPDRVALAGWSNGAMALLWALKDDAAARPKNLPHDFIAGVAFYPGCTSLRKAAYRSDVPILLQVGLKDNWTLPKPCIAMVPEANARGGARMEIDAYPDAVHGFDHPSAPVRAFVARHSDFKTGEKEVLIGSDPVARQQAIERVTAYLRRALAE